MVADRIGTAVNSGSEIEALGFDSLEFLELLQAIEGVYGVVFPDEAIQRFDTLGDIFNYAEVDAPAN